MVRRIVFDAGSVRKHLCKSQEERTLPIDRAERGVRERREKIFNVPIIVVALVALLFGIHGLRQLISVERDAEILLNLAFVPGRFTYAFDPNRIAAALDASNIGATQLEIDRLLLGNGRPLWWTPATYALLHANWAHVGLNCLWFVPFGAAVARRFGDLRFVLFCIIAAVAGALAHFVTHVDDLQPIIGASAVVSATMGAALRFVFQPGGQELGIRRQDGRSYSPPALSLRAVFSNRTAVVFLIVWFIANLLVGLGGNPLGFANATIAWQAHIGGFLFGLIAFPLFDRRSTEIQPPPLDFEPPGSAS